MQEYQSDRASDSMRYVCSSNKYCGLKPELVKLYYYQESFSLSNTIAAIRKRMVKRQLEESSKTENLLAGATKTRCSFRQLRRRWPCITRSKKYSSGR